MSDNEGCEHFARDVPFDAARRPFRNKRSQDMLALETKTLSTRHPGFTRLRTIRCDSALSTAYAYAGHVQYASACGGLVGSSGKTEYVAVEPKTSYWVWPHGVMYFITGANSS